MQLIGMLQAGVGQVKGIRVLHDELASADDTGAGPGFVAVLFLHLIQNRGQVLVGGIQVLYHQGKHLFVRGGQQIVPVFAVAQLEQGLAVFLPAIRGLVGFFGQQHRELQFLSADTVHLLANHRFHVSKRAQPQRQPRIDSGCGAANIASPHQQLVGIDFRFDRVFAQSAHKIRGHLLHVLSLSNPRHRAEPGFDGSVSGPRRGRWLGLGFRFEFAAVPKQVFRGVTVSFSQQFLPHIQRVVSLFEGFACGHLEGRQDLVADQGFAQAAGEHLCHGLVKEGPSHAPRGGLKLGAHLQSGFQLEFGGNRGGNKDTFLNRNPVRHFAQHQGNRGIERIADRSQQFGGGFFLAALYL